MTLYFIVSAVLTIVLIDIPILIGLAIFEFITIIVAASKANDGIKYRYPNNHYISRLEGITYEIYPHS